MKSDFVHWEDLDLDHFLGDYTEDERENVPEILLESDSDGDGSDECEIPPQPPKHKPKQNEKARDRPIYQCPKCNKELLSISGFRGHMLRKHSISGVTGECSCVVKRV